MSIRQPSTSTVHSTQHTAPVLEFRCLYTHDLRQKKKRWQDGVLRFHTFNKRIMVYDITRNFIGDTHWREDEVFQDGDSLQLDKGVLIQVGEAVGYIEQDLTPLLGKRLSRPHEPIRKDPILRSSRSQTPKCFTEHLTQLRPKSFIALLGMPRGTYGRAQLPKISLFQERQCVRRDLGGQERPAKRQQLSNAEKLVEITTINDCEVARKENRSPSKPKRLLKNAYVEQNVTIIESDDDEATPSSPVRACDRTNPRNNKLSSSMEPKSLWRIHTPTQERLESSINSADKSIDVLHEIENCRDKQRVEKKAGKKIEQPLNSLRFASPKRRRMLIYNDLPAEVRPSSNASSSPSLSCGNSNVNDQVYGSEPDKVDNLTTFQHFQRERLESRLSGSCTQYVGRDLEKSPQDGSLATCDTLDTPENPFKAIPNDHNEHHGCKGPSEYRRVDDEKSRLMGDKPSMLSFASHNVNVSSSEISRKDQIPLYQNNSGVGMPTNNITDAQISKDLGLYRPFATGRHKFSSRKTEWPKQRVPSLPPLIISPLPEAVSKPSKTKAKSLPKKPACSMEGLKIRHPAPAPAPANCVPLECMQTINVYTKLLPKQSSQSTISRITGLRSDSSRGTVKEVKVDDTDTDLGPWSREAFDLFGWGRESSP